MSVHSVEHGSIEALLARLKTILPEEYQECYDDVQPVSMGSAGLKYGPDGKVAWDQIWGTFCDLAMAGGPPHKGKLLEPGSPSDIDAQADRYQQAVQEICRGISMVTELPTEASPIPGWVRVTCTSTAMAEWLVRAITTENVSAHSEGLMLDLPAGSDYRDEKEIKNVVTSIAKTCHYWQDHMWSGQQRDITELFAKMTTESPLLQPALSGHGFQPEMDSMLRAKMATAIQNATGLRSTNHAYAGWLGLECPDVRAAIWMMRALVVST
ncbi:MAG: hypothetical protein ABI824_01295 [Acidobacteriota bacterium]